MTFANMVYISDFRVGFHKLRLVKIFIVQRRSFIVNNVFDFYEINGSLRKLPKHFNGISDYIKN